MADIGNRLGTAQLPALTDDNKILLKACVCTFAFDIANHWDYLHVHVHSYSYMYMHMYVYM